MLCPKCGKELKDGSKFCQFCGSKMEAEPVAPVAVPAEAVTIAPPAAEKQQSGSGAKVGLIVVAVVAVLLLALNAVQYFNLIDLGAPHVKDLQAQVADAETEIADLETKLEESEQKAEAAVAAVGAMQMENNELNKTINAMEGNVAELEALIEKMEDEIWVLENDLTANGEENEFLQDNYDKIINALSSANLGRASDKFKVDKGYVVLKKSASPINVTLTADFDGYVTVTTNRTGSAAEMSFNESTWNGDTTTLKVTPKSVGVATVKFTNSIDSQTFTVLIIVTE